MSRRTSETYEKNLLQKNCNQIFVRGPALTRELLDKMQKKTTNVWGCEIETRQLWVMAGLIVLFLISGAGVIMMWFTNFFDNAIFSQLAINRDSQLYEIWRKPSPKPQFRVYLFNYTNTEEFLNGDAPKLQVSDIGPYVYEMSLERTNQEFVGDTVTYQEDRSYRFMPELSNGRQSDQFVTPNIPMISVSAVAKHYAYFSRLAISQTLRSLDAAPFTNLAADRIIVGYVDNLYSLLKSVLKLQNQQPYEKIGLLASSSGLSNDIYTVNTGTDDINKVTRIESYNGKASLPHWSTEDCNSLKGATDGTMYSPKLVRHRRPLKFFVKEMCRPMPLNFDRPVSILNGKIPAYRYKIPTSIFDSPERTAENQCYCNLDSGECPPQGVFNATPCMFGAPGFTSFPHFYNADPELREGVLGLHPNSTEHESYADLHPTLGFVMAGKTRFQFNVQVLKSAGMSQLNKFEDGVMLPVAWYELSLEDKTLPEDMVSLIFQTTFTVKSVELGLKYGCILGMLVTLIGVLLVLRTRWESRERTCSMRPLQRNEQETV